jgi:hypothetical protein
MGRTGERPEGQDAARGPGEGPRLADGPATDPAVVGLPAVVTIRIPGGRAPGEVCLFVRGTYESLIAYALEPLDSGRHVVVVASRGHRAADVEPTTRGT